LLGPRKVRKIPQLPQVHSYEWHSGADKDTSPLRNGNRFRSGRHKSGQAPFGAYSSARRRALFAINWTRRRVREEQCR